MTTIYPQNPAEQSDFWDALEDEVIAAIADSEPFILTKTGAEPTQVDWETAWTGAGNTLPIPANKRLIWWDTFHARGEYGIFQDDYVSPLLPLYLPQLYYGVWFKDDGDLIAYAKNNIYWRMTSAVGDDGYEPLTTSQGMAAASAAGFYNLNKDGTLGSLIFEPIEQRQFPGWDNLNTRTRQINNVFFSPELNRLYLGESTASISRTSFKVNATANNAFFENAAGVTLGPQFPTTKSYKVRLRIASTSASNQTLTVSVRASGGTVLFSSDITVNANTPFTDYTFTGTTPGGFPAQGTIIKVLFQTAMAGGEFLWFSHPSVIVDTSLEARATWRLLPQDPATTDWTPSNVNWTNAATFLTNAVVSTFYNIVEYDLTTSTPAFYQIGINSTYQTEAADIFNGATAYAQHIKFHGVDSSGNMYVSSPGWDSGSSPNAVPSKTYRKSIFKITRSTKAVSVIYTDASNQAVTAILVDAVTDKIVLGYGAAVAAKSMTTAGGSITTLSLYDPQLLYDGKVYGTDKGTVWPSSNVKKVRDLATDTDVAYTPLMPGFEAFRDKLLVPNHANQNYSADVPALFVQQVMMRPFKHIYPRWLWQNPVNSDEYLAVYGDKNIPLVTGSVEQLACIINESGSTGHVRRIHGWSEADPTILKLGENVLAGDEVDTTFDITALIAGLDYDITKYGTLFLVADMALITANDTMLLEFNGDTTAANYVSSNVYGAAAVITKQTHSLAGVAVAASSAAFYGKMTFVIPGWQLAQGGKPVLGFGGSLFGITTGLIRAYYTNGGWKGAAINKIRITTTTAANKLRNGNVYSLYALKTVERFGFNDLYTPSMA